jgi:hypothetical protein
VSHEIDGGVVEDVDGASRPDRIGDAADATDRQRCPGDGHRLLEARASPMTKGTHHSLARIASDRTVISGPMPAASPMVIAIRGRFMMGSFAPRS